MTPEIIDCEQGTPQWFKARAGIPTASEFATVMASGRDGGASKTRRAYMMKLAGERITGEPAESFTNKSMDRGHVQEPRARALYTLVSGNAVDRVGFIRAGNAGASPDGLVGADGGVEIKSAAAHVLLDLHFAGKFPSEHVAQVQGNLWITTRDWWDLIIFCPKMKPFLTRAYRDEDYIARIESSVQEFNDELEALVERYRALGDPDAARETVGNRLRASLQVVPA